MRLPLRLALQSIALIALAIVVCCALLLYVTADNHIRSARDGAVSELKMLHTLLSAELDLVLEDSLSDTAKRSLVLYVFRKYSAASASGAKYALKAESATLYNGSPIDPTSVFTELQSGYERWLDAPVSSRDDTLRWSTAIAEFQGHTYIVAGHYDHSIGQHSLEHEVFLVRDITAVYDGIASLCLTFALIAFITILLCAALMALLIRRALRPLQALEQSAAAIAAGDLSVRADLRGKDELAALGASFNAMADAVSANIDALSDRAERQKLLLSALTHELKTPMTAIIGYSDTLSRTRLSASQQQTAISYIGSECRRLERLSQKLMRLIALEGGEAADICERKASELFGAVEDTLSAIAASEGITLELNYDDRDTLKCDLELMSSVVLNLFDNARKAGAKHICIELGGGVLSVSDDGCGMAEAELSRITEPFYMVDKARSLQSDSSGLGLALCEVIARVHGARLSFESAPGSGTVVQMKFENYSLITDCGILQNES